MIFVHEFGGGPAEPQNGSILNGGFVEVAQMQNAVNALTVPWIS
jgi:hypothetical protein